jgi:putative transposase
MNLVAEAAKALGTERACAVLSVPRASFYRWRHPMVKITRAHCPPLKLSAGENEAVIQMLYSERFVDSAPRTIVSQLLDEGIYLCSASTLYRRLQAHDALKERRQRVTFKTYQKPELLATAPNQVYSWDITKLKGPQKWSYFHLYVIMDIYSRYVVGWLVADRESSDLADALIAATCERQNIQPGQLTLHADRGPSMTSKQVAHLLADLGVTKTHNRPYTSNDNPYSESQFKTLKYCPAFPKTFGCLEDARSFCRQFFTWYNEQHHHSGIAYLTPKSLHYGQAEAVLAQRHAVLLAASVRHPARFKHQQPIVGRIPEAVWINKPGVGATLCASA